MPQAQTIGLETLSKYFHLPINDVAKELGVCATVLKKICRKNGIPRWPHRKIKSLDKMIMTLEVSVAKNPEDGERIRHEIHTLKNKKMFLMKNPNVLATKAPSMKKGAKASSSSKDHKSPLDSPSSPSSPPYQNANFPYFPPYSSSSSSTPLPPNSMYGMYAPPSSYAKYGYPPPYASPYPPPSSRDEHHRSRSFDGEECLSPSLVLDPVAAALYLQVPHPHMPHPSSSPPPHYPPSLIEKSQWVPTDYPSAFTPTKPPSSSRKFPASYEDQVPSSSLPPSPSHLPPPQSFLIHLPELRLPDENKPNRTLSTLEPELFPKEAPSASSPQNKWQLPEWFEAENRMRREVKEEPSEVRVPTDENSPRDLVTE